MSGAGKKMDSLDLSEELTIDDNYSILGPGTEETEVAESVNTLATSLHTYRYEDGRRYHDYRIAQLFPNDDLSKMNEACLHITMIHLLKGQYYMSPISEIDLTAVADVGSGQKAFWSKGMAEKYTDVQVVSMDMDHPDFVEPNIIPYRADVCDSWELDDPNMLFDLVYVRNMFVLVSDWRQLYANAFAYV
jgi:hypothetical protein